MTSIIINSLLYSECIPEWRWDTRINVLQDYDLWYIAEGEGQITAPTGVFRLVKGSCFILRPGEGYLAIHNPEKPLTVYAIHFDLFSPGYFLPFVHYIEDTDFFETLCKRLFESEGAVREVWMLAILNEYSKTCKKKAIKPTLNQERTQQLQKYIKNHLEEPLLLDKLAEIVFLSRNQTTRVFKQITGKTIQEYILKERIIHAMTLLSQSTLPIKRVAQLCGYQDPGFFCRHFKRISGTTPNNFRNGSPH